MLSVDGNWNEWTSWSICTTSCEGGMKTRTRQCNNPLPMCNGSPCQGQNQEYEQCNIDVLCKSHSNLIWYSIFLLLF